MRTSVILAVLLFGLGFTGSPLFGQACGEILPCSQSEIVHSFGQGGEESSEPDPFGYHGECKKCQVRIDDAWFDVDPEACHRVCNGEPGGEPEPELREAAQDTSEQAAAVADRTAHLDRHAHQLASEPGDALEILLTAAAHGDLENVITAGAKNPSHVSIHPTRRAIQIFGCERRVIASLPLGELYDEAVAVLGALGK